MAIEGDVVRILLVEDDEDDYLIVRDMLSAQQRTRFQIDWCSDYQHALESIGERRHDVYLIDYRLGARTGLELVGQAFASAARAPVILLTGQGDYEVDLEATALGVTDYITKQGLDPDRLERSIRYAISHHRALRDLSRSEERYELAALATNDGIWDWDLTTNRIYLSPRWHTILGLPDHDGDSEPGRWFELVHDDDVSRLRAALEAHLAGRTPHVQVEHRIRHADGRWRWVLTRGVAIRDTTGAGTRIAGSMADITDRRKAERQLQHDALHDPLTGLPNRTLFIDRVDQILQRAVRDPSVGCAVLFLDVDRFKLVNDSLSHAVGDQLLAALARRLADTLRPGDTVARIGGDEFVLLIGEIVNEDDAKIVAERIQAALGEPFSVGGHELAIASSIGIAHSSPQLTATELIRNADIAMYHAKDKGSGAYTVFDESMHQRIVDRVSREQQLRQALEKALITVDYQPIVDLTTGQICEWEALARWPGDWEELPPLEFIPIAEETGMIRQLGLQVMHTALTQLARWRTAGLVDDEVSMAVNISSRQLDDPNLPEHILAAITAAQLSASALRLEITESTLMHEPERIQRIVSEVCTAGVSLHLDDFGTGYSSLGALQQFPLAALKIDRSFVASLPGNIGSQAIVRSTIALAHSLGLQVIAEGIEQPAQLEQLRALGCDLGQGFLFSEPLPAQKAGALLETWVAEPVETRFPL
jgi:diguanylate cyclase (GGDEF)-like protein/PAS domain S-box-containing protein